MWLYYISFQCIFLALLFFANDILLVIYFIYFFVLHVLSHFSHVQLLPTLWTAACQAPPSMGFFQARILEKVAMSSSRGSSQPRDQTHASYSPALVGSVPLTPPEKPLSLVIMT